MEKKQITLSSETASLRIQADFFNGKITATSRAWQSSQSCLLQTVQPEKLGLMLQVLECSVIKIILDNFDAYTSTFEVSETNKKNIRNAYENRLQGMKSLFTPLAANNSEETPSTEEEGAATANDSSEA